MGLLRVRHDWATELNWTDSQSQWIWPSSDNVSLRSMVRFVILKDLSLSRQWRKVGLRQNCHSFYPTYPQILFGILISEDLMKKYQKKILIHCLEPELFYLQDFYKPEGIGLWDTWARVWKVRVQFSSVAQSCPTLCNTMNHSTPGLPVHHHLLEFTQTHVHRISDAIQPPHPLMSRSPPAPNPSQHHSLFQWVNPSHEVDKVLEFQL